MCASITPPNCDAIWRWHHHIHSGRHWRMRRPVSNERVTPCYSKDSSTQRPAFRRVTPSPWMGNARPESHEGGTLSRERFHVQLPLADVDTRMRAVTAHAIRALKDR